MTAHGVTGDGMTAHGMAPARGTPARAAVLERRYRLLLLAYPRSYRRSHGTEILTTLMDAAAPDRARPTGREVHDLLVGGLRQRFRLPVGRSMVAVAVMSALALGALGSATGSALGWATASPAPDDAAAAGIVESALGTASAHHGHRDSQVFGLRPRVLLSATIVPGGWTTDAARERLTADGWRVGPVDSLPVRDETYTGHTFFAGKGGTEIMVSVSEVPEDRWHGLVLAQGAEPRSVLPLMLTGLVGGLLVGWLLAARIGYRVRRLPPLLQVPPVTAATVATVALGMSAPASLYAVCENIGLKLAPSDAGRFGGTPAFAGLYQDSPLDPVMLTGLGALAVLIVLTSVPRKWARTATT